MKKFLNFDSQVFLAPMAGITDYPMRSLTKSLGAGTMVSEMVAINALSRKNPKSYRIADVRNEDYPVVVQLVGGEPELFVDAAKLMEELGASSIDVNMGCPVRKIVNNDSGSNLMKDMDRASKIIETLKNTTKLNISTKFRKGWDHNSINAVEFAHMCQESGADYVTVHGRTRSDFYSGVADWDIIADVKSRVKIPVIGNGDVDSPQKAKELLDYTKCDGVMVGRAALGAPWLISQIHEYINNGVLPVELDIKDIKQVLLAHIKGLTDYYGERLALPLSRKYVCWYSRSMRDAKKFREAYMRLTSFEDANNLIDEYFIE